MFEPLGERTVDSASATEVRKRYGVPHGMGLRVDGREALAWMPGLELAVREVASRPDDLAPAGLGGRRGLSRLLTAEGPVLVREFGKGGLLRRLRGRRFRGPWRPLEELVLQRRLRALGVPVAETLGAVVLRGATGWRGFLLLREVDGAKDLEALLHGERPPCRAPLREVLLRAGSAVRRLHDAGVAHPDLHPKNLLVTPEGHVLVLDLDRARPAGGVLPEEARLSNLVRLGRSIEKHRLKGIRAGRREALRFLTGYAGSLQAAEHWLARVRERLQRGLAWRTLWWRLKGEARPWRPLPPQGAGPR